MFNRLRHKSNPNLCINHLTWRGNFLECGICDSVIATYFNGDLNVIDRYVEHTDKIHEYCKTRILSARADEWQKVLDLKKEVIENSRGQIEAIKEETEQLKERNDALGIDDPIPFTDIEFDDEDAAAGNFYLGNEKPVEENNNDD